MKTVYILACAPIAEGGGIHRVICEGDRMVEDGFYPCDRPMYAVEREDGTLFVVLRAPFADSEHSGSFTLSPDFGEAGQLRDTLGVCGCHLAVDGDDVYVTNYLSGNVSKNGETASAHEGMSAHPTRQKEPHTHGAFFTPDKAHLLVTDLGTDEIYVYDRALNEVSRVKNTPGFGVRHLVFSADGAYVYAANELVPSVGVFRYEEGRLTHLSTLPCLCAHQEPSGAAIRLSRDGKRLYYSVRGENKVFVIAVDGADLRLECAYAAGGDFPRDLVEVDDGHLLTCNEKTHDAVLLAADSGKPLARISARGALCAVVSAR